MSMNRLALSALVVCVMLVGLASLHGCGKKEEPLRETAVQRLVTDEVPTPARARVVAQSERCFVYYASGVSGNTHFYWVEGDPAHLNYCGGLVVR